MLACLMMVYTIYVMQASRVVSQDYWRAQAAYKALEHASLTDTLTQIPNRLHFDRQYQAEWRRACRLGTHLAVMIVDLDHFKRINDEHGHPVGDAVLQEAANATTGTAHVVADSLYHKYQAIGTATLTVAAIQQQQRHIQHRPDPPAIWPVWPVKQSHAAFKLRPIP
jgi:hypothetical protein